MDTSAIRISFEDFKQLVQDALEEMKPSYGKMDIVEEWADKLNYLIQEVWEEQNTEDEAEDEEQEDPRTDRDDEVGL